MARSGVIATLALSGALGGFLISYLFPQRYTAKSTVLGEVVVIPVVTDPFAQIVQTLGQNVLTPRRLRPLIQALNLGQPQDEDGLISEIQQHVQVQPMITTPKKEASASDQPMLGINVEYTSRNAVRAQNICNALASLIVDENLRLGSGAAYHTVEIHSRQLKLAQDELEHKRALLHAISESPLPRGPKEEATHKALALGYNNAQVRYKNLLAKQSTSELGIVGESEAPLGENVRVVAAVAPQAPSFPNRPLFALCGLFAGLLFGASHLLRSNPPVVAKID